MERDKAIQGKEGSKLQINVKRKWGNNRLTKNKQHLLTGRQNRADKNLAADEFLILYCPTNALNYMNCWVIKYILTLILLMWRMW